MGRFGLGRWVVSANFLGESIRPWVVSAKVYGNLQVSNNSKDKLIFLSICVFVDVLNDVCMWDVLKVL